MTEHQVDLNCQMRKELFRFGDVVDHVGQFHSRAHTELSIDVLEIRFDSEIAQAEVLGNLSVALGLGDESGNLYFAWGQSGPK